MMNKHSRAFEQYCWVKKKNVVLEETVFHNGTRTLRCTSISECDREGGCRNNTLEHLWNKSLPLICHRELSDN